MHSIGARPFRLLGDCAVRAVRNALAQTAHSWASDWGLASALVDISVQRAWDSQLVRSIAWGQGGQAAGRQVWLAFGPDLGSELEHMLFAADPGDTPARNVAPGLAPAGALQALDELLDALVRASLSGQQDLPRGAVEVPTELWKRGSGGMVAKLALGTAHCHILLDSSAVQALLPPATPFPPLSATDVEANVSHVPVSLRLHAGTARVGLAALLSLAPGDIIPLKQRADSPLALNTLAGHTLFGAYLGRSGDGIAVELAHCLTQLETAMNNATHMSATGAIQHIELPELEERGGSGPRLLNSRTELLDSIGVDVSVVVGQAHTTVGRLMNLKQADILKIDRSVEQAVDIVVNGNIIARGQLVVVDDSFGVQITEVAAAVQA